MTVESSLRCPPKPGYIAKNPVASAEWDRICEGLQRRADVRCEVQEYLIADPAETYALIALFKQALDDQGRSPDTRPMAEDCDRAVDRYLRYVAELGVQPSPLIRIRLVGGDA